MKTPIIFKSLYDVCKQKTFRNVKRDNRRRENTANVDDDDDDYDDDGDDDNGDGDGDGDDDDDDRKPSTV